MAWSNGKNKNYPKQRLSDHDSSSEDESSLGTNLLKNCSCNHPNCPNNIAPCGAVKNRLSHAENVGASSIYSNLYPSQCAASCSFMPVSGGISYNSSAISHGNKWSSSISNPFSNLTLSSCPPSNIRLCKSLSSVPANAASAQGGNEAESQQFCGAMNNLSEPSACSPPVSNFILIENKLAHNDRNISDHNFHDHNAMLELPCNQELVRIRTSYNDSDSAAHAKNEKPSNLQPIAGPLYNWQATMTTVKERFAFLFNNEILSDIHFRVGKGESCQRIPAHRFVLAVGSAVFDAMFFGKLCTQQEEIELPDVEPQAFLSLLRFLYSDEVQIGPETVMTVLYTAKKYAVPALERHCVEYLKSNLSPDNAFMLLTQARLFDEPQLAALCLETIDKNTSDALLADGFTDIDHKTLTMVLERDTLRIREAKLFQAVVRWSESKCLEDNLAVTGANQRSVLGEALSLIRFPLMTIEEFAQTPAQSDILTDKEVVQLFLYFTVNPKPSVNFLDIPRCCMTGKEQTVCRFQQIESRWGYSGTSDRIRFIVDRRIFVVGFGMYGSIHGPSEYEVTIQIIHTVTGKVCVSNDTSFISDGTVNTFRVMFKEPIEVLPNTNYTAYATLKGPDSHYGTKGVRKVSVECPSGDRVTFQFTYAAGNNNGTSVEDGQIPEIIFYT